MGRSAVGEILNDLSGTPERIRTSDLRLRRPSLYPAELRALAEQRSYLKGREAHKARALHLVFQGCRGSKTRTRASFRRIDIGARRRNVRGLTMRTNGSGHVEGHPTKRSRTTQKRERDLLLAAICHDLRAPLAAVTMGANFVLQTTERQDANDRSIRILDAMLRSCAQMERLIRNFGDLSEIESDTVTLHLALHDAGEMAELAAAAIADAARLRSVSVELRKPNPPIMMTCDRERILCALGHVLDNAIKVAPEGSTVTLSVGPRADDVCFEVTDRGAGLSADVRKNVFDRLWLGRRAERSGPGYGLAIARGFLEAHGGRIALAPPSGSETTFTLSVPKNDPTA